MADIYQLAAKLKAKIADQAEVRTASSVAKEIRDIDVYVEYTQLMKRPGAMNGPVVKTLMVKYGIKASSTIWEIRRRTAKKINALRYM